MLLETMQQKQRLIRDLGTLPRNEMQQFKDFTDKQLSIAEFCKLYNVKMKTKTRTKKKS